MQSGSDRGANGLSPADARCALTVAMDAAREAGEVLLDSFEALQASDIDHKSSARDLVSKADVAAERSIVAALRRHLPGHAIEAEEEVRDAPRSGQPRWLVDPLDGTVNFIHGIPLFCVSMALYVDDQPQVAVVHMPKMGETFWALRGGGAYLEHSRGQRRLAVTATRDLSEAILATGFPYRREEWKPNNLENFSAFYLAVRGLRRTGSAALDLAWVAAGRLDGYWELYLSPHDLAGGALLVREAGGIVTDTEGGQRWLRRGDVVVAGPALHPKIQERLQAPDPRWGA